MMGHGLLALEALLTAVFCGAVLTPFLLPWLPGRAFSVKGFSLGILGAAVLFLLRGTGQLKAAGYIEMLSWFLLITATATYLAMNFTGASTYTSLSGVKKEIRRALPIQIGAGFLGLCLWVYSVYSG